MPRPKWAATKVGVDILGQACAVAGRYPEDPVSDEVKKIEEALWKAHRATLLSLVQSLPNADWKWSRVRRLAAWELYEEPDEKPDEK